MSKEVVAKRLEEAGLGADRLVDVKEGTKESHNHTHLPPEDISGNYGVHARAADRLVLVDVDDYEDLEDTSGLTALTKLPPTFEQKTPHGGTHRFYRVEISEDGRFPSAVFKDEFDLEGGNPGPSWGEVRAANQYVVGAGSQLADCDKCDKCATSEGGKYEVNTDREIATVPVAEFVEVLKSDPAYSDDETEEEEATEQNGDVPDLDLDHDEILEYALEESNDDKLKRLWRGDYSDYGGDRSEAESALAYKLAFWLQGDKNAVRRAMDRANTKKWAEREDDSYRESVLSAVGAQTDHYEPSRNTSRERAPTYDEGEVERGEALLRAETTPEDPAGELCHRNGKYGYWYEERDEHGEIVDRRFDPATNFTLETLETLETDEGELLKLKVHPSHPMEEPYEVDVHPTVFNETRSFKEEIVRGKTTRYEPGAKSQQALNDLRETVGSQLVPNRKGQEHIGLASDQLEEWVSPEGVIAEDGEAEDPDHRYYSKGGSSDSKGGALARKWNLDPATMDDYDEDTVARILELMPKIRKHERGLPILGWFYAAPLRPLIHRWAGEFNLLQVVGTTGTGKTSTLKAYWEAFGMDPNPFSASATPFTLMKHMASSNGVPVWIDEYKPADIRSDRLDTLHRRLREVTKGGSVSKGQANLGEVLFELKAPVVISGEQKFSQSVPAVRRRAIMTHLSQSATEDGTEYTRAFCELTGTAYEDDDGSPVYPTGHDLSDHARAFYTWMLRQSEDNLRDLWNDTRERTGQILTERGILLEETERHGAQIILFGVRLFRRFAEDVGASVDEIVTDDRVGDSFAHYASNIGKDGKRMGYDDTFLELFAQAASEDYVEEEEDFRFIDSKKYETEVLAFHMPSVYPAVQRYVRDYNLEDEYNIIGKNDYVSAFKDKIDQSGHVLDYQKQRLAGGNALCMMVDSEETAEKLGSDFDLRAFGRGEGEETDEETLADEATPLASLHDVDNDTYVTVTVEAEQDIKASGLSDSDRPILKADAEDETGEAEVVTWDEHKHASDPDSPLSRWPQIENDEPTPVAIRDARLDEYDGVIQLVLERGKTKVQPIQKGVGYTAAVDPGAEQGRLTNPTATDGSGELEGARARIAEHIRTEYDAGDAVTVAAVAGELTDLDPEKDVEPALEALAKEKGQLNRNINDGYEVL